MRKFKDKLSNLIEAIKLDIRTFKRYKKEKVADINAYFNVFYAFTIVLQSIILIFIVITSICYIFFPSTAIVVVVFVAMLVIMIISSSSFIFFFKKGRELLYDGLYLVTKKNIDLLAHSKRQFEKYDPRIAEFKVLNDDLDSLENSLNNIIVASKPLDLKNFDLVYLGNPRDHVITSGSFQYNLRNFILASGVFRNAVIFIDIVAPIELVKKEYYYKTIEVCRKYLLNDNMVFAIDKDYGGIYIYFPKIDTISYIEERLHKIVKEGVIQEFTATGSELIKIRASYVIFPYSQPDAILSDLRYANRKGKLVNGFIPQKARKFDKEIEHQTLLFAAVNKIYNTYNTLELTSQNAKKVIKKVCNLMGDMREYLGFETTGTIMYYELTGEYYSTFEDREDPNVKFMNGKNDLVSNDLVDAIISSVDADNSFFFSRRETVNDSFARACDVYGIKSGNFFIVKDEGIVISIIYFVNKTRDALLTSNKREALVTFDSYLGIFSKEIASKRLLSLANQRSTDMMRLSDLNIYTVNEETFKIGYFSDPLKDRVPSLEAGKFCYECIYGRSSPCEDCPIKTRLRKISSIKGEKFSTSVQTNRGSQTMRTMVCKLIDDNQSADRSRFNADLLVFSGYSLSMRIQNVFSRGVRGQLVLITIDNARDLVYRYKEGGYFQALRTFLSLVEENKTKNFDIFLYKQDMLAIILNEEDRSDITAVCENINKQSTLLQSLGDALTIRLSFLIFPYPSSFSSAVDFNRHVERYLSERLTKLETSSLVFTDTGYTRKANRELFLVSLLDKAIENHKLPARLHPIFANDNTTITGAEVLIRVEDPDLRRPIDTTEFIDTLAKYDRIGDLSINLLRNMAEIIDKYGNSTFRAAGFRYFAINTDASYLKNETFLTGLSELMTNSSIPRGMLSFEIQEKEIYDNKELLLSLRKRFESYNILLVCDNYTGDYLSVEECYRLGIRHCKFSLSLVLNVTEDISALAQIKSLLEDGVNYGISMCFVGIETKEHLRFLDELGFKAFKQGYYLSKPLDVEEFMVELKDHNILIK